VAVKKQVSNKSVKKAPAKKATVKQPIKKVAAKKTAPKKAVAKKVAPKKTAKVANTKKVVAKKVTPAKKVVAKKLLPPAKKQPTVAIVKERSKIVAPYQEKKEIKHIAIAGNIGSGKTTLTEQLAKQFGWEPHFEDVENNPYLNDFYTDMIRWSFNLQIYFLNSRFRQIINFQKGIRTVIQDRTIYEDAYIFAPNLHAMGLMSTRDFDNYVSLFETIKTRITPPDLLIYLRGSIPTLVDQIQKRGREYEENLRLDYLKRLNEFYETWINKYDDGKLLIIDIDTCNFADDKEQLGEVVNKVQAELFGLF
jgi:deoxyadenosine/deoxycytidine kinase